MDFVLTICTEEEGMFSFVEEALTEAVAVFKSYLNNYPGNIDAWLVVDDYLGNKIFTDFDGLVELAYPEAYKR